MTPELKKRVITCKFCKHEREVFTGESIKRIRKNGNMTLRTMADILEVSVGFLNDCEHDRRNCGTDMSRKLDTLKEAIAEFGDQGIDVVAGICQESFYGKQEIQY